MIKKIKPFLTPTLAIILITSLSCEKHDEDLKVSLDSRENRITKSWSVSHVKEDHYDVTDNYEEFVLNLGTNSNAELNANYISFGVKYEVSTAGFWYLNNNNENLKLDFNEDDKDASFIVTRLTNDELWLEHIDQNLELHLASN